MGVTGACCSITVVRFAHSMLKCSAAAGMLRDLRSQVAVMWWPGCEGLWHRSSTSCSSSSRGRESLRRQRTETCGHPWFLFAVVVDRSSIIGATVSEAEDDAPAAREFDGRGTLVVAGEAVESLASLAQARREIDAIQAFQHGVLGNRAAEGRRAPMPPWGFETELGSTANPQPDEGAMIM